HFTFGGIDREHFAGESEHPNVYRMVVQSFREPLIAFSYVVAQVVLGMHLSHGIPSLFTTLGLSNRPSASSIRCARLVIALVVVAGNVSIPLTIWLRIVGRDVPL